MKEMLAKTYPHIRDDNISYTDDDHKYFLKSGEECISVTTLISKLFPVFNKEKEAERLSGKGEKYRNLTTDEILTLWSKNNEQAQDEGKKLHSYIERFLNGENLRKRVAVEYSYFHNFFDAIYINPYRTEWIIYDEDILLAGTLDCLFLNSQGRFCLCDWKRAKDIDVQNKYRKFTEIGGLSIPNTSYMKYTIQLNLYAYILKKKYNINVETMCIVNLHPDQEDYSIIGVERRKDLVDAIIKLRSEMR
jgi:hypothetical protein